MEKPSRDRIEISTTASGLDLNIRPKREIGRWSLLWLPVGFVFWVYSMYTAVGEILDPDRDGPLIFSVSLLVGLVVGAMAGVPAFLWSAFGREVIEVYAGRFVIAKELHGIRYRSKSFNTLEIEGLQAREEPNFLHSLLQFRPSRRPNTGRVAFEAKGVTYRFGESLEEDEAAKVAEHVQKYLPQMRIHA
ncbi:MAG: hypothetical protein WA990_12745 [Rubrobacteraceae bacterium]